jgi:hypothetical protein
MAETDAAAVPEDPVELSTAYLRAVRRGEDTDRFRRALRRLDPDELPGGLPDDGSRKAFWLNVYNAVVQDVLGDDPGKYEKRRKFFSRQLVRVAGKPLSLDGIEHGILRRSQPSWGLGYLKKPKFLVDPFVRNLYVDTLDPRIHFALNCGASSCPPIAAYTREGIDDELDLATESYFETDVAYDPDAGVVRVPRLLLWYRGDFGGRSGIYDFLETHGAIPEGERPKVKYRDYDWSLSLGEFRESATDR